MRMYFPVSTRNVAQYCYIYVVGQLKSYKLKSEWRVNMLHGRVLCFRSSKHVCVFFAQIFGSERKITFSLFHFRNYSGNKA